MTYSPRWTRLFATEDKQLHPGTDASCWPHGKSARSAKYRHHSLMVYLGILQRLHHVQPDLVAVLEAVGHDSGDAVHPAALCRCTQRSRSRPA